MLLFFGVFFGYQKFYNNPDNVTNFSSYGKKEDKDIKKSISKVSNVKDLPYAEEVIKLIMEEQAKDSSKTIDDIVYEKYGEEISFLANEGLLPSNTLSNKDNTMIILSANKFLDDNSNYFPPNNIYNTYDYIQTLGESSPKLSINNISVNGVDSVIQDNVEFSNETTVISNGDINLQGVSISKLNEDNVASVPVLQQTSDLQDKDYSEEEINTLMTSLSNTKLLTVNFILTDDMKIDSIEKELKKIKLNDKELQVLTPNSLEDNALSVNMITYLKLSEVTEVSKYSVLSYRFIITEDVPLYSGSNYVTFGKNKIELRPNTGYNFTDYALYDSIEF